MGGVCIGWATLSKFLCFLCEKRAEQHWTSPRRAWGLKPHSGASAWSSQGAHGVKALRVPQLPADAGPASSWGSWSVWMTKSRVRVTAMNVIKLLTSIFSPKLCFLCPWCYSFLKIPSQHLFYLFCNSVFPSEFFLSWRYSTMYEEVILVCLLVVMVEGMEILSKHFNGTKQCEDVRWGRRDSHEQEAWH